MNLIPVFLIGLLGSVHCIGMCGGIVGALSMAPSGRHSIWSRTLFYNLGRISSYMVAGILVGSLANGVRVLSNLSAWQSAAYILTNVMLIALGLYLMDVWRGITKLEVLGQQLWRRLQPMAAHLMPLDHPFKLFLAGSLWGWLPCGMVYSVLVTAMLSSSASSGAAVMLAFGAGTLPMLLIAGVFGAQLRTFLQQRAVRLSSGAIVAGFGFLGLMRAKHGLPAGWADMFCV